MVSEVFETELGDLLDTPAEISVGGCLSDGDSLLSRTVSLSSRDPAEKELAESCPGALASSQFLDAAVSDGLALRSAENPGIDAILQGRIREYKNKG